MKHSITASPRRTTSQNRAESHHPDDPIVRVTVGTIPPHPPPGQLTIEALADSERHWKSLFAGAAEVIQAAVAMLRQQDLALDRERDRNKQLTADYTRLDTAYRELRARVMQEDTDEH